MLRRARKLCKARTPEKVKIVTSDEPGTLVPNKYSTKNANPNKRFNRTSSGFPGLSRKNYERSVDGLRIIRFRDSRGFRRKL